MFSKIVTVMMKQLHCKIHGRVQGVFFRAATCGEARRLGLTGWVKNCADGSVECMAEGPMEQLNQLREWLSHGPSAARVERVEEQWRDASGEFKEFGVMVD